jgi:hypothetical protein
MRYSEMAFLVLTRDFSYLGLTSIANRDLAIPQRLHQQAAQQDDYQQKRRPP